MGVPCGIIPEKLRSFMAKGKFTKLKYLSHSTTPLKHSNLGSGRFKGGINKTLHPTGTFIAQKFENLSVGLGLLG